MRNWKKNKYNPPPKKKWTFFSKMFQYWNKKNQFFFSKVLKFTWKMWNQLNWKKNQISDFSDLYFSSYGYFCCPIFIYPITVRIDISIVSEHCGSSEKTGSKLSILLAAGIQSHRIVWERQSSVVSKKPECRLPRVTNT